MESLEVDEDIQPLTAVGSSTATSRRHLSPSSNPPIRGPIVTLLMFASIGAVYMLGKERGQSLRFDRSTKPDDVTKPGVNTGKMFLPKTAPALELGTVTDPPVPTYDPTMTGSTPQPTDETTYTDVPTYDEEKVLTPQPVGK